MSHLVGEQAQRNARAHLEAHVELDFGQDEIDHQRNKAEARRRMAGVGNPQILQHIIAQVPVHIEISKIHQGERKEVR